VQYGIHFKTAVPTLTLTLQHNDRGAWVRSLGYD